MSIEKLREVRKYSFGVDCDGVLHSYTSPWVAEDVLPDPPVEGAIEWLNEITKRLNIFIHTTRGRSEEGREAVAAWLRANGYEGPDLEITDRKLPALGYLDDRGFRFSGPGTFPTADQIHAARPWNK